MAIKNPVFIHSHAAISPRRLLLRTLNISIHEHQAKRILCMETVSYTHLRGKYDLNSYGERQDPEHGYGRHPLMTENNDCHFFCREEKQDVYKRQGARVVANENRTSFSAPSVLPRVFPR